ncbi:MAG: hypothetical protein VR78_11795 [Hoeflea sp. BRH_c9]|nr:MAG: hypothetical protein VR78_11795 [Hoeflea sp. BRH_c9]
MFGFTEIARYARQWRASRKRAAMVSMFDSLPLELQKDIGWPAAGEPASTGRTQGAAHAHPML